MKKLTSLALMIALGWNLTVAQVFTTNQPVLQEQSENVVITFHADVADSNGATNLKGTASTTPLYVHIGVYTTKSPAAWSHVLTDWPTSASDPKANTDANKLTWRANDTWDLNIGNLRTYFGITDEAEKITKVCVLARNAAGSKQTADCFLDVMPDGYQIAFSHDAPSTIFTEPTTVNFSVNATAPSTIKLYVNDSEIASASNAKELTKSYSFSTPGTSWTVKAVATDGATTREQKVEFLYPAPSPRADYPGGVPRMGAVAQPDGDVIFCLAAPGKSSVMLVPSWDDYQILDRNMMKYQDYEGQRYFWIKVSGLDPDKSYPYYYLVDATTSVGDPYAHLVLDPYNDRYLKADVFPERPDYPYDKFNNILLAVYHGNQDRYDWQVTDFKIPAKESLVIYEMLLRDFTGRDRTADGTINMALEKIPYLVDLGINAIELMPVMEFNGNNSWGYNTNFYMALDKAYGSPDDLKRFIDTCHANGIAVLLDIVFNQSDGLHPWYQMYPRQSNPFYNSNAPHDYSVLNDWIQDNPLVQQQWEDAITYWMTAYKVDGFRFDLVKGLGNNDSYKNGTEAYNASRVANMIRLHNHIKAVNPDALHINENLAGEQEECEMAADGQFNWSNQNGNSANYAKGYASSLKYFSSEACKRPWGSNITYAESHDEERIAYSQKSTSYADIKNDKPTAMSRLASVGAHLLMTPGSIPMIWQFGELAADETTKKNGSNNTDPKKVLWSRLDDPDYKGIHESYRSLIHARRDNADLFMQDADVNIASNKSSDRHIRLTKGDREMILLVNPGRTGEATLNVEAKKISGSNYQVLSSSENFTNPVITGQGTISCTMPHSSYVVIGTTNLAGIDSVTADSHDNVSVSGADGKIIITGDYDSAEVYDISGRRYNTLNVPAGLYIVKVDGTASKVIVK